MIESEQTMRSHDNQRCEKLDRQIISNSNVLKEITYHAVYIPHDNKPSPNNGKCIANDGKGNFNDAFLTYLVDQWFNVI